MRDPALWPRDYNKLHDLPSRDCALLRLLERCASCPRGSVLNRPRVVHYTHRKILLNDE